MPLMQNGCTAQDRDDDDVCFAENGKLITNGRSKTIRNQRIFFLLVSAAAVIVIVTTFKGFWFLGSLVDFSRTGGASRSVPKIHTTRSTHGAVVSKATRRDNKRKHPVTPMLHRRDNTTSFRAGTLVVTKGMEKQSFTNKNQLPSKFEICDTIRGMKNRNSSLQAPPLLYNLTEPSCSQGYGSGGGTGNKLAHLIGYRFAIFAERNTALIWDCGPDAIESGRELVRPWLSGYFPPANTYNVNEPPFGMIMPDNYCPPTPQQQQQNRRKLGPSLPLRYMIPLLRHDFRRMAVGLVGVPSLDHPSAAFAKEYLLPEAESPPYTPSPANGVIYRIPIHDYFEKGAVFPNVQLDQVVIHFRCGDVLLGAHGEFRYVKYVEYSKLISPETRSIGIVTQPFSADGERIQARKQDRLADTGERCKALVYGLIDHLKNSFPNATYTIHNGPNETVALAYARMVMANQTLALISSTFSVFPAVTSFGTGYFPLPIGRENRVPYGWLTNEHAPDLYHDDGFELLTFDRRLRAEDLAHLWDEQGEEAVLKWFRDKSFDYP